MDATNQTAIVAMLQGAGVDVMLAGHWHYYSRYVPFNIGANSTQPSCVSADGHTYSNCGPGYWTQIVSGAQAVQVFDSWIGALSPSDYVRYVKPHMQRLFSELSKSVPHIHFGTGTATLLQHQLEAGGDVIGFDWRVELGTTWERLGAKAVQGNLDPYSLLAPREELKRRASDVLASANRRPGHIFNLGHGIFPEASVDQVKALVDHVHEASQR